MTASQTAPVVATPPAATGATPTDTSRFSASIDACRKLTKQHLHGVVVGLGILVSDDDFERVLRIAGGRR